MIALPYQVKTLLHFPQKHYLLNSTPVKPEPHPVDQPIQDLPVSRDNSRSETLIKISE